LKNFNITATILSIITIIIMLVIAPFSKQVEKAIDIPEISKTSEYKININTADESELSILDGLGEVTARAIIDYRDKHGVFKSISELDNVRGIGEGKISKWCEFITTQN